MTLVRLQVQIHPVALRGTCLTPFPGCRRFVRSGWVSLDNPNRRTPAKPANRTKTGHKPAGKPAGGNSKGGRRD